MPAETVFSIVNAAVLPFWLMLVFIPHHKLTTVLVHSGLIGVIYGVLYVVYLGMAMSAGQPDGAGMGSLAGLQLAFSDPRALLGAWIHYLVFDLFVGAWITRDAKRQAIAHPVIVVPIVLTLMAGPLGLLLYLSIRGIWKQRFTLQESEANATPA